MLLQMQFWIMATLPPKLSRASCSSTPITLDKTILIFGFQMLQRSQWRAIRMTTARLGSLWPRCWKTSAWRTPRAERVPTWWRNNAPLSGQCFPVGWSQSSAEVTVVATDLLRRQSNWTKHQQKQFNFKKHGCVALGFTYCDVTELFSGILCPHWALKY